MKQLHPNLNYIAMDATQMLFNDNSYDNIIDKGTFDALMCSETTQLVERLCSEMIRVCKNKIFIISHSPKREEFLAT